MATVGRAAELKSMGAEDLADEPPFSNMTIIDIITGVLDLGYVFQGLAYPKEYFVSLKRA